VFFQNKMNRTSIFVGRVVPRIMSEGKSWKSECLSISFKQTFAARDLRSFLHTLPVTSLIKLLPL
jgi:hypothetical protein